jgi:hypothetical protein
VPIDVVEPGALEALDLRLRALLPETYQDSYEAVQPVSMGSAGLKYDADGLVAWDQIWGSFCDLAMAGGPPHRGALLEPGIETDIDAEFARYDEVAEEICRGVRMVTGLRSYVSQTPGWVCVTCLGDGMAGWLVRAIVMENVAARRRGAVLELPAAPHFRVEKEVKNVVTVIAKTCHYWVGHTPAAQQRAIADLLLAMDQESPLLQPEFRPGEESPRSQELASLAAGVIERETGLRRSQHHYPGWLGIECASVGSAVWMMRSVVAGNVLSRREGTVLLVPINPESDPDGGIVSRAVTRAYNLASAKGTPDAGPANRRSG